MHSEVAARFSALRPLGPLCPQNEIRHPVPDAAAIGLVSSYVASTVHLGESLRRKAKCMGHTPIIVRLVVRIVRGGNFNQIRRFGLIGSSSAGFELLQYTGSRAGSGHPVGPSRIGVADGNTDAGVRPVRRDL